VKIFVNMHVIKCIITNLKIHVVTEHSKK